MQSKYQALLKNVGIPMKYGLTSLSLLARKSHVLYEIEFRLDLEHEGKASVVTASIVFGDLHIVCFENQKRLSIVDHMALKFLMELDIVEYRYSNETFRPMTAVEVAEALRIFSTKYDCSLLITEQVMGSRYLIENGTQKEM